MGFLGNFGGNWDDCETGDRAPSGEFPAGSQVEHLYCAALWAGALVGNDTLVSTAVNGWQSTYELWPCSEPECGIHRRSNRNSDPYFHPDARSELEYVAIYTDTLTDDTWTGHDLWDRRLHIPLNLEITQTSYSWNTSRTDDFIIVNYDIENAGDSNLHDLYVGIYVDGDIGHISRDFDRFTDDICGFRRTVSSMAGHELRDTVNLAWIADNDGDPSFGNYDHNSATSVIGITPLRWPDQDAELAFNWWSANANPLLDWGPMREPGCDFGTGGRGVPEGDYGKYCVMSHPEIDYDQIFSATDYSILGWFPPAQVASTISRGCDIRFLLSAGPFDLHAGQSKPFSLAIVAGERFHQDPMNFENQMIRLNQRPDLFYYALSFQDVSRNAIMAGRVFDNPGVDTDGDGYFGRFRLIYDTTGGQETTDTFYYAGDGIPDLRVDMKLPAPRLRFSTADYSVTISWNGLDCEKHVDAITRVADFEGYNIYLGREPRIEQLALVSSHDLCNFAMLYWDDHTDEFIMRGHPLTLRELRELLDDSQFNPDDYPCSESGTGYEYDDRTYCFEPVGWNQSIAGWDDGAANNSSTCMRKPFAEGIEAGAITPEVDSLNSELWVRDIDPTTGDSVLYHKYYEYECTIDDLLPSVPHYLAVTAFDFGDISHDFDPTETSPLDNVVKLWPVYSARDVLRKGLEVRVYPNPYVSQNSDRASMSSDYHSGLVFADLPPGCNIQIYTVSGDLVKRLSHPSDCSETDSQLRWDMRNKEDREIKSGIFIYFVESEWGNQIGKFIVIR
jgi:hypothetical protein